MTTINLNLKVKAGPRTPVQVTCYGTSVNEKAIKFRNGQVIKENSIANWVTSQLQIALEEIQNEKRRK